MGNKADTAKPKATPKPKVTTTLEVVSAEDIATMARLAHHQGVDQRRYIGQAKNEEDVACNVYLVVGQDGAESTVLVPHDNTPPEEDAPEELDDTSDTVEG